METISRRNTETFEKGFKELTEKSYKQQEQIDGLTRTITMMYQKMIELEQQLILQKGMKMTGLGPSVKE